MTDTAILVENISKRYRIGAKVNGHETFAGRLSDLVTLPVRNFKRLRGFSKFKDSEDDSENIIWALRDVSFEVKKGEVVGIIGRNGAGKSTLLKILTRITEPTSGSATISGRVGSLLEVGTGFHPELTGRDNVYLNGAILGMTRKEIKSRFDEIVDFSGVEKFIDTPVKRYSSGMKVRLAFAVAAHLEPEILLVDEVLAVGDSEFQKKCLGKMGDVANEGRTVLFVSHNMAAIQALCSRAINLSDGAIVCDDTVDHTLRKYLDSVQDLVERLHLGMREDRTGGESFRFQEVEFLDSNTLYPLKTVMSGQPISVRFRYRCDADSICEGTSFSIAFYLPSGTFLFECRSDVMDQRFRLALGEGFRICNIPRWPLSAGRYLYNIQADRYGTILDWVTDAGYVDVEAGDFFQTGRLAYKGRQGVYIDYKWEDQGPVTDPIRNPLINADI